jgi:hypothetical protein
MSNVFVTPSWTQSSVIDHSVKILCYYINATSQLQIAKITDIPGCYFERVVFPGQRLLFEALPTATLEIFSGSMASSLLIDKISCQKLEVRQEDN